MVLVVQVVATESAGNSALPFHGFFPQCDWTICVWFRPSSESFSNRFPLLPSPLVNQSTHSIKSFIFIQITTPVGPIPKSILTVRVYGGERAKNFTNHSASIVKNTKRATMLPGPLFCWEERTNTANRFTSLLRLLSLQQE